MAKGRTTKPSYKGKRRAFTKTSESSHTIIERRICTAKASPNRRHSTRSAAERLAPQLAFTTAFKRVVSEKDSINAETARKAAAKAAGLHGGNVKRDILAWLARMGINDFNADLDKESLNLDVRDLMHNTPGQGRKAKFTESETQRLVDYLSTHPEHKAGVVKWPSCAYLADNEPLQRRLRIPKACEVAYAQAAFKAGCKYLPLYSRSW